MYVCVCTHAYVSVCMCTEGEDKLTFFLKDDKLVFCLAESGNSASHWPRAHKGNQAVCLVHHFPGVCLALQPHPMNACIKFYFKYGFWVSNIGPHVFKLSNLLSVPSPQPIKFYMLSSFRSLYIFVTVVFFSAIFFYNSLNDH